MIRLTDDAALALLVGAPNAMLIADSCGSIVFVNAQTERMFGITGAELVGRSLGSLLPKRFESLCAQLVAAASSRPGSEPAVTDPELSARRRDGSEFPLEMTLRGVAADQGVFVVAALYDLSASRSNERRLIAARETAELANRAKSRFLAAASHDLRQPLQTLSLLSGVLSRSVPFGSQAATAAANQAEALRWMGELLNSLLDISKLEAGAVTPDITDCSVERIFRRLRAEFAVLAESKGLDLIIEDSDSVVRTDPALLSRIMQNLIGNAIRYTRRGWVRLRCFRAPDTVRIEVLDTGIGIPSEEIESVFAEYYRSGEHADESRAGAGLGLAIARRMADLLGCVLEVSSSVGNGSKFSLTVPRARRCESPEPGAATELVRDLPAGALVVVIDDDPSVAEAMSLLLGSLRLDCIAASGVADALAALDSRDETADLTICDYHLGNGITGVGAIRAIRAALSAPVPAIVLSGDTSARITAAIRTIERCELLAKPVDTDELVDCAGRLLQGCGRPAECGRGRARRGAGTSGN